MVVLAIDAPVPTDASGQHHTPQQPHALSIGSKAGWLAQQHQHQHLQQGRARELEAGAGAAGDKFMSGLGEYLKEHSYHNSNYTGVWDAVGEVAGEPVEQYMSTWTLRR